MLRRTMKPDAERLCFGDIAMDLKMHAVTAADVPLDLTLREFEILKELMENPGEAVTRTSLVTKLWGYDASDGTRIVDTHIKNIRKKLAECGCASISIYTIRGAGYQLRKQDP